MSIFTHLIHLVLSYLCGGAVQTHISPSQGTDARDLFSFALLLSLVPALSPPAHTPHLFSSRILFVLSLFCHSSVPLLLGFGLLNFHAHSSILSIHFRQVITLTLLFSAVLPLLSWPRHFSFLLSYYFLWFTLFPSYSLPVLLLHLLSSTPRMLQSYFVLGNPVSPSISAWLCTAPLIGSREIIPVEHDVLDWI